MNFQFKQEDNTSNLTDKQKKDLKMGELCSEFGITEERLKEMIEQEKRRNEQQDKPNNAARKQLREYYTKGHIMICQICQHIMPFDLPNGHGPYFECVELFPDINNAVLALCPTCAANYKIFVKSNENMCQELKNKFNTSMPQSSVDITLGTENTTIYFKKEHWRYINLYIAAVT